MLYGEGISREGSVIDMAQQVGVVEEVRFVVHLRGDQLGQGRRRSVSSLRTTRPSPRRLRTRSRPSSGLIGSADQFAEDGEAAAAAAVSEAAAADVAKDSKAAAAPAAKTTRAKAGTAKA